MTRALESWRMAKAQRTEDQHKSRHPQMGNSEWHGSSSKGNSWAFFRLRLALWYLPRIDRLRWLSASSASQSPSPPSPPSSCLLFSSELTDWKSNKNIESNEHISPSACNLHFTSAMLQNSACPSHSKLVHNADACDGVQLGLWSL